MTATPEEIKKPVEIPKAEIHPLEELFYLGYATSDLLTVYKDDKFELTVKFRTLVPTEMRDVMELCGQFETIAAKEITERIETLARALIEINKMPLILTAEERKTYHEKWGENPSPLDMAREILLHNFKSMHVIDAMFEAYIEFSDGVTAKFVDLKKKLKNPNPSVSTSP